MPKEGADEGETNMKLTLKDGSVLELEAPVTVKEAAAKISEGLARAALGAKVDGVVRELNYVLDGDHSFEVLTFKDDEGRKIYRHTCAHVLAQAVKSIFPTCKLAIGPAIENGFYYDIDFGTPITMDDLSRIAAEMKNIIKANYKVERFTLSRAEALKLMRGFNDDY